MAYRRRQGITKSSTFKEEIYHPPDNNVNDNKASFPTFKASHSISPSTSQSLAAQAIRASAIHRDSSLSSAYSADPPLSSETQGSKVGFFLFSFFSINLWIGFCFFFYFNGLDVVFMSISVAYLRIFIVVSVMYVNIAHRVPLVVINSNHLLCSDFHHKC